MWAFAISLTIAAGPPAPLQVRPAGAIEVAHFGFPETPGVAFNKPVGWTRQYSPGFPFYIDVELTRKTAAEGTRSLAFHLNGGNCAYFSPEAPASADFNYVVEAKIKTDRLVNDVALVLLEFLDQNMDRVGKQHFSQEVGKTTDWTPVNIPPVAPESDKVRFLRVACVSLRGEVMDLAGTVYFDDIWVGKLPRYEVTTNGASRILPFAGPKKVRVRVTGAESRRYATRFYLSDENRRPLAEAIESLAPDAGGAKKAEWTLPIDEVGFYHLDVGLYEGNRQVLLRDFPVTVIDETSGKAQGGFGLSAPTLEFSLDQYDRLMGASGSRWLLLPLWAEAEADPELGGDRLLFARFVERLAQRGQEVVGVLSKAPPKLLDSLPRESVGIADVFALPKESWRRSIEGLMAQRGLVVTHWRLGGDADTSFEGLPNLKRTIRSVEDEMRLIGRDVRLGMVWKWTTPIPTDSGLSFLSMTDQANGASARESRSAAPLSADALLEYLRSAKTEATSSPGAALRSPALWVDITPLADRKYSRLDQVVDLARRVVASKVGGADAIVASNAFDPQIGLVDASGAPNERFTLWRTLARHLGGAEWTGQWYVPGVRENHVFVRDGRAVLVVWNDSSTDVPLILGREVDRVDLWGRRRALREANDVQTASVGPVPILITGIGEPLARFQIGVRFAKGQLPSEYGVHNDALIVANPFPVGLSGVVRPRFPAGWNAQPETIDLQIAAGETATIPLTFDIPQGAGQGTYPVPLEFDFTADRHYRFPLPREYRLGGDEVGSSASARLLASGELEVEIQLTNLTAAPMSLTCTFRAFRRQVQQAFISQLGPNESAVRRFLLPDGRALLGATAQVDIDQVGGRRQITLRFPLRDGS